MPAWVPLSGQMPRLAFGAMAGGNPTTRVLSKVGAPPLNFVTDPLAKARTFGDSLRVAPAVIMPIAHRWPNKRATSGFLLLVPPVTEFKSYLGVQVQHKSRGRWASNFFATRKFGGKKTLQNQKKLT